MVKINESTEVYLNADGVPVVQDPNNSKLWRRVSQDGLTATMFATPPPAGAKPMPRPQPVTIEVAEPQPDPAIADISETLHRVDERLDAEVERLQRVIIEKDTVISDLTSDKAKLERDKDAVIESRDNTIRSLNTQLEAETNTPRADPVEIDRLKKEIQDLTLKHGDELKATREEGEKSANAKLAEKEKSLGEKDDQIAKLKKDLKDLEAKPASPSAPPLPPPPPDAPPPKVRGFFARHPAFGWIAKGVVALSVALVIGLAWYGYSKLHETALTHVVTEVTKVPGDCESVKNRLSDAEAKLSADEKSKAALVDALKQLPPQVSLQHLSDDPK